MGLRAISEVISSISTLGMGAIYEEISTMWLGAIYDYHHFHPVVEDRH